MSAVEALRKYGVSPTVVRYVLQNQAHIAVEQQDLLVRYYLKYWEAEYFFNNLHNGTITDEGTVYQVIYKHCTPTKVRCADQVALSFRAAQPEYELESYVIITVPRNITP